MAMARFVSLGNYWVAEVRTGEFGRFEDRLSCRRAEEAWWASPVNVGYEQWVERHEAQAVAMDGIRWNTKSIGWDRIRQWGAELARQGGWDGLSEEKKQWWINRCHAEAVYRGRVKVEREEEDLEEANLRREANDRRRHAEASERRRLMGGVKKVGRPKIVKVRFSIEREENGAPTSRPIPLKETG